ncbi:hypothetical protein [Winogradskya humida]|uniref:Uncharacterized protein n=1 Tax=Winogradskya humida TaxID=113566 RepID=A0ABQ4A1R6_9ACTN|nr:hypothetical protein [Actinoplanes humidus]GIE24801.1 hypothetical protein Ahu01nite_079030 [Actinoplanes humidus]
MSAPHEPTAGTNSPRPAAATGRHDTDGPGPVTAAECHGLPAVADDDRVGLPAELAERDPSTTPDDERIIETVLQWITDTHHTGPALNRWAQYALAASCRLHPAGHPQRERAVLADAGVRAAILPHTDAFSPTAYTLAHRIGDTGRTPASRDTTMYHLNAYLALHTRGFCHIANGGLRYTPLPAEQAGERRVALLTTVVVAVALASACGRDDLAATLLDTHAAHLDEPGTAGRALFAGLTLQLTDLIREHHQQVCTHRGSAPHDRHRFSALIHGEPPNRHLSPAPPDMVSPADPRKSVPVGAAPRFSLDGVLFRLGAHADNQRQHRDLHATPSSSNVWLLCDTCRLGLRLGATVVRAHQPDRLAATVLAAGRPAWQHDDVTRAVWRLLSDHCGHELRVITQASPAWRKYVATPTDLIGPSGIDPDPGIAIDAYLTGWPSQPTVARFDGATPAPPSDPADSDVSLVCLGCRLELVLGHTSGHPGAAITIGAHHAEQLPAATTAVFRMLTDHAGHDLLIFTDASGWDHYIQSGEWHTAIETGHDNPPLLGDITHQQYIDGWPTAPTRRYYHGSDPLEPPPDPGTHRGPPP